MKHRFSPQRSDNEVSYKFAGEIIEITLNGETETVNLASISQYPAFDGFQLTKLPINPIISVSVLDGKKYVELLKFHKQDAPEPERFGFEWEDVN
jgi:hypothetical protein